MWVLEVQITPFSKLDLNDEIKSYCYLTDRIICYVDMKLFCEFKYTLDTRSGKLLRVLNYTINCSNILSYIC